MAPRECGRAVRTAAASRPCRPPGTLPTRRPEKTQRVRMRGRWMAQTRVLRAQRIQWCDARARPELLRACSQCRCCPCRVTRAGAVDEASHGQASLARSPCPAAAGQRATRSDCGAWRRCCVAAGRQARASTQAGSDHLISLVAGYRALSRTFPGLLSRSPSSPRARSQAHRQHVMTSWSGKNVIDSRIEHRCCCSTMDRAAWAKGWNREVWR